MREACAAPRRVAARRGAFYLAAAAAFAGAAACARPGRLPAPEAFAPVSADSFRSFASRTVPSAPVAYFFHWRVEGNTEMSGRGAVRLAPPDSLRLDVGVPIVGRATLVLAGESTWAAPAAVADRMLPGQGGAPSRAMVWALFGVVRPPAAAVTVAERDSLARRSFLLTEPGGAVTTLEFAGDTLLGATRYRDGRAVGQLKLRRDSLGALARVEAVDRDEGARFVLTVDRREGGPFPSEIWRHP